MTTRLFLIFVIISLLLNACGGSQEPTQAAGKPTKGVPPGQANKPTKAVPPGQANKPTKPAQPADATQPAPATAAPVTSTPERIIQMLFDAAQTQNFEPLGNLCDPKGENDGDTQDICNLATDSSKRASYTEVMIKAKIAGAAKISTDGLTAEVSILFGPDGTDAETIVLINRDGQWYLFSF